MTIALTDTQKKALVPASAGAATYALCREFVFAGGKKGLQNSLLAAAGAALVSYFAYDKADAATQAKVDPFLLPAGAMAGALLLGDLAVEQFNVNVPRMAVVAAAAGAGLYTYKELEPSSASVAGYLR